MVVLRRSCCRNSFLIRLIGQGLIGLKEEHIEGLDDCFIRSVIHQPYSMRPRSWIRRKLTMACDPSWEEGLLQPTMCSYVSSPARTYQQSGDACYPCVGSGSCCNCACGGGHDGYGPSEHQRACLCRRQRRREISCACCQSDEDCVNEMSTVSGSAGAGSGPCASEAVVSDCQM